MEQFKTDTGTTNKKEAYFCERKEQSKKKVGKSSSQVNFGPNKMIIVLEVKKKKDMGGGGVWRRGVVRIERWKG